MIITCGFQLQGGIFDPLFFYSSFIPWYTQRNRDKASQSREHVSLITSIYANSVTNNMHGILSELYVCICIWLNIWTVQYWFVFPSWISNHKTQLNASLRSNNINNFRPFIFILSRHPSFSMWTFAGKKKEVKEFYSIYHFTAWLILSSLIDRYGLY